MSVSIIRSMGGLVFDAVFSEDHSSDLNVTDNPVENGVVVSDHAYMDPLRVTIQAGVSDSPIAVRGSDQFASGTSRSKKAFDILTDLQRAAEPFDVQTGLRLYKNMVCTSIKALQDKDSSSVLNFVAELREVIIVYTQTVKYKSKKVSKTKNGKVEKSAGDKHATPKAGATSRQASPVVNRGEVKTNPVSDSKSDAPRKSSLLKKMIRLL